MKRSLGMQDLEARRLHYALRIQSPTIISAIALQKIPTKPLVPAPRFAGSALADSLLHSVPDRSTVVTINYHTASGVCSPEPQITDGYAG